MAAFAGTLVVGLAGHVDHGKTSLVHALTGVNTDRLEEERRRGLTIELGFAHTRLASGRIVSFVDVPGHERFVRTMAAGVSGIDAAMLVIDAREGIMAQTREHADILRLLGIRRVLAVLSKSDLVTPDAIRDLEQEASSLVGRALHGTIGCSAKTGDGVDRLRGSLADLAHDREEASHRAPFRMPIDRVFAVRGSGTVVTGTVWQGLIRTGDTIECAPDGGQARVRGIQTRGRGVDAVGPGQRAAINLSTDRGGPQRGHDLVAPARFATSRRLTIAFELLRSSSRSIRSGTRVTALLGTRTEPASLKLVDTAKLEPGYRCLAQLIFTEPVVATGGQTLLVRSGSPELTIGGGTVRSVFAPGLGRRDTAWHERLRSLDTASPTERLQTAAWMLGEQSWADAAPHQEAGVWDAPPPGVPFGLGRIDESRLASLTDRVAACVESMSDGTAVERSRIISAIPNRRDADVLAALDLLVTQGRLSEAASGVTLPGHEDHLAPEDRAAIARILRLYESYGCAPRPADDLPFALGVRSSEARRLSRIAIEHGRLVHLSGSFFVTAPVARDLEKKIRRLLEDKGRIAVADVRALLGVSRKHAVPICEYLDRVRITRRIENERVLFEEKTRIGGTPSG